MSTKPTPLVAKLAGLVAGALAITVIAVIGHATDHDSFAKGAIIGGCITLAAAAILWLRGARGGAAARVASGMADERERTITMRAQADAGASMLFVALGMTIASLWGVDGIIVGGAVLWAGVLTFVLSFLVRARRS